MRKGMRIYVKVKCSRECTHPQQVMMVMVMAMVIMVMMRMMRMMRTMMG